MRWLCRNRSIDLARPVVMGVLNVTPDSVSDGGRHADPGAAFEHAAAMVEGGARIVDVGGESTKPGSKEVPAEEEMRRILPVIERLAGKVRCGISVDTRKAKVAEAADMDFPR